MAEQTEFSSAGGSPGTRFTLREEDAGRLDGASRWRLIAIVGALVLFAEAITFQQAMISNIVPKLAVSFPQAGANVTWSITILGVAGGATMALVGKAGDMIGKKRVLLICGVLFLVGCLVCAVTTSIGSAVGIAVFTAIVAALPLRLATTVAGHTLTSTVPGVYTDSGYVLSYIVVGIVPAAIALILALFLRSGRTPSRGGAPEPATAPVLATDTGPVTSAEAGGR
jgi:MFS family permease